MSLLSASTGLYAWRQAAHASSFPRPGDALRPARQSSRTSRFADPSASVTITITWSSRCLLPATAALR